MSGREMFVFNPDVFVDDDEAVDDDAYKAEEDYQVPDESQNQEEEVILPILVATTLKLTCLFYREQR